ncbi:hypothetical protein BCCH1_43180 [Burkholderia contaminans]|uniref:Uncharacterized protein n=1 Tax=Burkholderia contaminans TaxID=488447 RepID=A0A250LBA4_9BURK|nr:hypothetical protein BCCH1_43180 [Burkholderia contaminans]GLZ72561.1 hypothetical protein Bcon01_56060 [Burkholderia contaminans]
MSFRKFRLFCAWAGSIAAAHAAPASTRVTTERDARIDMLFSLDVRSNGAVHAGKPGAGHPARTLRLSASEDSMRAVDAAF